LRPDFYAEAIKEVIDHAKATERRPSEVLRAVREAAASQAVWQEPRGFFGISEAQILLPFLRELENRIDNGGAQVAVTEDARLTVRSVRLHPQSSCTPQGRGPYEQHSVQHPDPLHLLSQLLARAARQAFEAIDGNAPIVPLLEHGVPARVGKLRALGNAIVPQAGAEVIRAFMEIAA
jgi:hypothetical protein